MPWFQHTHDKPISLRSRLIADEIVDTSPFVDNTKRGGFHIHVHIDLYSACASSAGSDQTSRMRRFIRDFCG